MKKISRFDGKVISVVSMEKTGEKKLSFFLVDRTGKYWLFDQKFSMGVHTFFQNGVRDYQVRNYGRWGKNPRLDKTITKIPIYVKYLLKEVMEERKVV